MSSYTCSDILPLGSLGLLVASVWNSMHIMYLGTLYYQCMGKCLLEVYALINFYGS